MASEEHLQQLAAMSSSSSSGEDDDDDTSSDDAGPSEAVAKLPMPPPKMRIKFSLRMPSKKKSKVSSPELPMHTEAQALDEEVSATVVDSDEAGDDDAVAAVVEEPVPVSSSSSAKHEISAAAGGESADAVTSSTSAALPTAAGTGKALVSSKRRPQNPSRPIRLPPMSSPGLLIPPSAGLQRVGPVADTSTGFVTPASVFDHSMSLAGYTKEGRTQRPHRGSSIQRVVGDMFDTNVAFSNQFPPLVPSDLFMDSSSKDGPPSLHVQKLMRSLERHANKESQSLESNGHPTNCVSSKKRRRPWGFRDIIPVPLTASYPESYIDKRIRYVEQVRRREEAIVAAQKAEEEAEIAKEQQGPDAVIPKPEPVPPIPEPPTPPRIEELEEPMSDDFQDNYPLYPPKASNLVAHLDAACFHITDGRYFGLLTNSVADPHFCGPNAPGVVGLTVSCGSGLATSNASSGGGGGGGGGFSSSNATSANVSVSGASAPAAPITNNVSTETATTSNRTKSSKGSSKKSSSHVSSKTKGENSSGKSKKSSSGSGKKSKKKQAGPAPTASNSDLRNIMEENGELAGRMRSCIIRAAVHASRSGQHGQSFLGPDGQSYPDVSKAFAAHAGLKPCIRCKNNKQGAYHCRLRRKHKDVDHDGKKSHEILAPLFLEPMEDLLPNAS